MNTSSKHKVNIKKIRTVWKGFNTINVVTLDYERYIPKSGKTISQKNITREVADTKEAVTCLLYSKTKKSVILIRQLRIGPYKKNNLHGILIEACAGKVDETDKNDYETSMIREIFEETGYKINDIKKIFSSYMSPGFYCELVHFFIAEYKDDMKISSGGGLHEEGEDIEVLETGFDDAIDMIEKGEIIDAKTIMLLQYAQIKNIFEIK